MEVAVKFDASVEVVFIKFKDGKITAKGRLELKTQHNSVGIGWL